MEKKNEKIYTKVWFWFLIAVFCGVLVSTIDCSTKKTTEEPTTDIVEVIGSENQTVNIEKSSYISVSADEILSAYEKDINKTKEKYNQEYIDLSGRFYEAKDHGFLIGPVDKKVSNKYILLFYGYDGQQEDLQKFNTDDKITVKCKMVYCNEELGIACDAISRVEKTAK